MKFIILYSPHEIVELINVDPAGFVRNNVVPENCNSDRPFFNRKSAFFSVFQRFSGAISNIISAFSMEKIHKKLFFLFLLQLQEMLARLATCRRHRGLFPVRADLQF